MNRPLKRLLGFTGAVLLGTLGAVALGSPAQAHHNTITAGAVCANGKIQIDWTIQNSEGDKQERFLSVEQSPSDAIKKVPGGQTIAAQTTIAAGGTLKGVQLVDANTQKAKLKITAKWAVTGWENTNEFEISLATLDCEPGFTGTVSGSAECVKDTGDWKVTWQVSNQHPGRQAKVDIVTDGPVAERTATSTGGVWTPLTNEGLITDISDGTTINAASTKTANQLVPGTADAARLKVLLTWTRDNIATKQHSATATINFTETCVKNEPKPRAWFASDCSGIVTVTLRNGSSATKDAVFVVIAAGGWTSEEIVLAKGETEVVSVPADNSSNVVVKESGAEFKRYSWHDSTNCHPVSVEITHTCAGVEVELNNPEKGAAHSIKLVPTSGDTVTKTVQPGDNVTFKFAAPNDEDEFKVEVFIDDKSSRTITWERPNGCEQLDVTYDETCTGLIIHLDNPLDGSDAAIVLTPTPGEPVSFTLKPGEKKDVEFLAGANGLSLTGTLNEESTGEALVWEKPEDCPPPILPKTGDNTAAFIASGSGLVALGAVVFFLARRRMMHLRRLAS